MAPGPAVSGPLYKHQPLTETTDAANTTGAGAGGDGVGWERGIQAGLVWSVRHLGVALVFVTVHCLPVLGPMPSCVIVASTRGWRLELWSIVGALASLGCKTTNLQRQMAPT